jgi:hypothetical protein
VLCKWRALLSQLNCPQSYPRRLCQKQKGHLVGQFPERWRCAGLRNPVLNIALMVGLSDIPDWCYVEVLGTEVRRGLLQCVCA